MIAHLSEDQIASYVELVHFCVTILGAFLSLYLMQAIMTVHTRLIHLQRFGLGMLAIALMASALGVFSWFPHEYSAPASVIVLFALDFNLLVMVIRGHIVVGATALRDAVRDVAGDRVARRIPDAVPVKPLNRIIGGWVSSAWGRMFH